MAKKKPEKVAVNRKALLARVNRKLAEDNQTIRAYRTATEKVAGHEYYRLDLARGAVTDAQVKLAVIARELEVLRPWEKLAD